MRESGINITTQLHERKLVLHFPTLPVEADGLRIAFIADLHIKRPQRLYGRLIEYLRERTFDVACCAGDTQYGAALKRDAPLEIARAVFAATRPRLGWFVVRGNNDSRTFFRRLKGDGVRLLNNQSVRLTGAGENQMGTVPIFLAGVDDPHYRCDDLDAALEGVPDGAFTVLLAHSPDVIHEAAERGVRLVLCGHTHGGQIRLPLAGALVTQTRVGVGFAYGLTQKRGTTLYTTSGVGYAVVPVRVNCPAEVVDITLRRAPGPHVDSGPVPI